MLIKLLLDLPHQKSHILLPLHHSQNALSSISEVTNPKEYFQSAVKFKRKKPPPTSPYPKQKPSQSQPKNPTPSTSKSVSLPNKSTSTSKSTDEQWIDCGFVLYQNSKLQKNTGILNIERRVNLCNKNLFDDLLQQLWNIFSREIPIKTSIKNLPPYVDYYLSLSQGKSCLTNQETLVHVLEKSTNKKPVQINLTYQHPTFHDSDHNVPSSNEDFPLIKSTSQSKRRPVTIHCSPDTKSSRTPNTNQWALGGLACTMPPRSGAGLRTQLGILGQGTRGLIDIKSEGWTHANQLIFKTNDIKDYADPQICLLNANCQPIILKVHSKRPIGKGTMRTAFKAEVKITDPSGFVTVVDFIAKKRHNDHYPQITKHARDALMYQGSALLLADFKKDLPERSSLKNIYRKKFQSMNIVRHAVVIVGAVNLPTNVYFLEAALVGNYVKYSSNVDFDLVEGVEGVDTHILWLMNSFTHWSFQESF
ncbi:hypothetical protein PCASD_24948 [Puccinia coronata f. sp. avenae]|uniref:Alpha-type protein kinase domain-containing protein n=1 Tax=Puccinia coronata f. sp. avenae TaxID=200324 RepID=A0A2N5S619_9BASI|nr:hypothetical protein PCASD_24948 [Puccinia coronata f. sp. avenae]